MQKRNYIIIICVCLIILSALVLYPKKTVPTITYFPIDSESSFQQAENKLQLHQKSKSNNYSVSWKDHSVSNKPLFLRQDVSVLYKDGQLIGVKSIWEEDVKTIEFNETFAFKKDHLFQAMTLHYGEKHYPEDVIKSIQKMSYSELFVTGEKKDGFTIFKEPDTELDMGARNELQKATNENLLHHWHRLTNHFGIDLAQYEVVPLTELYQFEEKALMSFTKEQTDEIIAKLWEGLYKNYIIPVSEEKELSSDSYVPLILFDKHEHDILVLFELNGEKIKLKQVFPSF